MSSVDMCEHDWPGSGCRECFPVIENMQVMPGSWFDLGQIAHDSCVATEELSEKDDND